MNREGKMSYKDFIFPVNPSFIRISSRNNIAAVNVPYGTELVTKVGRQLRIISGEGEFFGDDCTEVFETLRATMQGGGGMLYIPSQKPIYAYFESLEMKAGDIDGVAGYSFRFAEAEAPEEITNSGQYVYGDGKSCLWDYAYRYEISIDRLTALNRHIKRPDIPISVREKVLLC